MQKHFNLWVVVEGHAKPGGSTSWCNNLELPPRSTDGTHEYLKTLGGNLRYYSKGKFWESKDEQVNKAISLIKRECNECTLWQVDCDEVWNIKDLEDNEKIFLRTRHTCGKVQFNHIVGRHNGSILVAKGVWGSGFVNRVWKWKGEDFISHEPPRLQGKQTYISLPYKFDHYSMYFENDVAFKAKYYQGYDKVYENWKKMHQEGIFPCHVTKLLGPDIKGARTSRIYKQVRR